MSNKHTRLVIKPIKTGFLVEIADHYYDGNAYAFETWDEVLKFIADKPVVFLPQDAEVSGSTAVEVVA